jgi:hypothetical protein
MPKPAIIPTAVSARIEWMPRFSMFEMWTSTYGNGTARRQSRSAYPAKMNAAGFMTRPSHFSSTAR